MSVQTSSLSKSTGRARPFLEGAATAESMVARGQPQLSPWVFVRPNTGAFQPRQKKTAATCPWAGICCFKYFFQPSNSFIWRRALSSTLPRGTACPFLCYRAKSLTYCSPLLSSLWIYLGMTYGTKGILVALHLLRRRQKCQERPERCLCIVVGR